MIGQILSGYRKLFMGAAKVLALLAFCSGAGFVLVWPLWYFAVNHPVGYTRALSVLLLCGVIAAAVRKTKTFVKILVPLLGILGFVWAILAGKTALAVVAVLLTLGVYGILAYGTKKTNAA
jgi:hypothetical protein